MNREKEVILFYVKHMPEKELFPLNRLVFLLDSVGQIAREDHSKKLKMMIQKNNNLYVHVHVYITQLYLQKSNPNTNSSYEPDIFLDFV